MLRYLAAGSGRLTDDDLWRAVEAAFPERGDEIMMTVYDKWVQKGRQEGLLEGIELALDIKFGAEGLRLFPEIREIKDVGKLKAVQRAFKIARTPDEVRRVYVW